MHEGVAATLLLVALSVSLSAYGSLSSWGGATEERIVTEGDHLSLTCASEPSEGQHIVWSKQPLYRTSSPGSLLTAEIPVEIDPNRSSTSGAVLSIVNVTRLDAGFYKCFTRTNRRSVKPTSTFSVLVQYAAVIQDGVGPEVTTEVGNTIQLVCNASGYPAPSVMWRRVNHSVPPLDDVVFSGGRLNISHVQKYDRGLYSCEAQNGVGPVAKQDIMLSVEFSPEISSPEPLVLQALNYSALLSCVVEAFPAPEVTWFRDEQAVLNDSDHVMQVLNVSGDALVLEATLRLTSVQPQHYGNYTCVAENKLGFAATQIILGESEFPVLPLDKIKKADSKVGGEEGFINTGFNVTGFILGMMPPLLISFYIILHLGFRSRYAEERPEEEGGDGLDEIVWEQGMHSKY